MRLRTTLFGMLLCTVAASAADKNQTPQVIDQGLDGKSRFYSVICPNGDRAGLEHRYKIGEMCLTPTRGKPRCIKEDDPDVGAKKVCNMH